MYFFVTDPILLPKMLNLDPKDDENFIPEPRFVLFLIPDSIKNTGDPNPKRCDSRFLDFDL